MRKRRTPWLVVFAMVAKALLGVWLMPSMAMATPPTGVEQTAQPPCHGAAASVSASAPAVANLCIDCDDCPHAHLCNPASAPLADRAGEAIDPPSAIPHAGPGAAPIPPSHALLRPPITLA